MSSTTQIRECIWTLVDLASPESPVMVQVHPRSRGEFDALLEWGVLRGLRVMPKRSAGSYWVAMDTPGTEVTVFGSFPGVEPPLNWEGLVERTVLRLSSRQETA